MDKLIAKTSRVEKKKSDLPDLIINYLEPEPAKPIMPTLDLSLNIGELKSQLISNLNQRSSCFIFLRRRENTKIELQREKVNHLIGLIDDMVKVNRSVINYQAELFLSQAVFENIIKGFYVEAQRQAELKLFEHLNALSKIKDESAERKLKLDALNIANLKSMAEVNQMEARTEQEKIKADLMREAVNNISKLPPSLQTYIYRAVFNPNDKQEDDILLQDEIREYVKTEREAQAELKKQEARRAKAQADLDEYNTKDEMNRK